MIRLTREQWGLIEHITHEEIPFVQTSMMVQQRFPSAEIWVDRAENPTTLIGLFPKDFFVWGDLSHSGVKPLLARARGIGPDSPGLEAILQEVWPEGHERLPSIGHRHTGHIPEAALPTGFRVEAIAPVNLALLCEIWPEYAAGNTIGDFHDYDDFFRHSYGYMAIDETTGRCVSCCAALSVSRERADHGLDTLPDYERRGLATAVSLATVREGLRRGLRPVWWTEVSNLASRRVAEKVGFEPAWTVNIFSRNENEE